MASNRTKWNRTALTAANEVPSDIHGANNVAKLRNYFFNLIRNKKLNVIIAESDQGAVAVELQYTYKSRVVTGCWYQGEIYFDRRVISDESAVDAMFIVIASCMTETSSALDKEKIEQRIVNLEDSNSRVVPWRPLSLSGPVLPAFLNNLTPLVTLCANGVPYPYAVNGLGISAKALPMDAKQTVNSVLTFNERDWTIRQENSYNKFEKERIASNQLVEGYVPTNNDKLFVSRLYNGIQKMGKAPAFFFYGPAGTGKSEMGKYFSKMTGIPYTFICCSAMTNESDLRGKPNKIASNGALVKFFQRAVKNLWKKDVDVTGIDNDEIQYSLTELVLACRYGWIIEIQEPSLIINAGTLGFLNCVLDSNRTLILPNGAQVPIHPNTTFIFTTNVDYEGCNPFNLSLLSRVAYVKKIDAPTVSEQIDRVMSVTGYQGDREDVAKVIHAIGELQEIIRDQSITQGIADIRGAIDCINDYQFNGGTLRQSAALTIENKTSLEDGYAEIISDKLDSILGLN